MTSPSRLIGQLNLAAAVVAGVIHQIHTSTEARERYPYLADIWIKHRLIDPTGVLTHEGKAMVDAHQMIGYELSMLAKQALSDTITSTPEEYQMLREGLNQAAKGMAYRVYAELVIPQHVTPVVLDIGGGGGQYLREFLRFNRQFEGILVDKRPTTPTTRVLDVYEDRTWVDKVPRAGVILLNEVLHLRNAASRETLLLECMFKLDPGGMLIIGERYPSPEFEWRMAAATAGGEALSPGGLVREIGRVPDKFVQLPLEFEHYFLVYRKS